MDVAQTASSAAAQLVLPECKASARRRKQICIVLLNWTRRHSYADDSTSMKYADDGARIGDLDNILARVAEVACLFDTDGISIRAINRHEFCKTPLLVLAVTDCGLP